MTYKEAADQYCQLYQSSAWGEAGNQSNLQEIYGFIVSEAMKIDHDRFRSDLKSFTALDFATFHKAVHGTFKSRLGHPWSCHSFDAFFSPMQKVMELSLSRADEKRINPENSDTLVIMLIAGEEILVDNKSLVNNSLETISRAVELSLEEKSGPSTQVYLYLDEGADGGSLFDIVQLLQDKGIEAIGLIGYSQQ